MAGGKRSPFFCIPPCDLCVTQKSKTRKFESFISTHPMSPFGLWKARIKHHPLGILMNTIKKQHVFSFLRRLGNEYCLFKFKIRWDFHRWISYRVQCLCLSLHFYCKIFIRLILEIFHLISIYSNIMLFSSPWLSTVLACRFITSLSWPNLFLLCFLFSMACSNSQLSLISIKSKTSCTLRIQTRLKL